VAAILESGAERAIVSDPAALADELREFQPTVVLDPLGGGFVAPVLETIAPRGRIVSLGTSAGAEVTCNMQLLYRNNVSLLGYGGMQLQREERRAGLGEALQALADGSIRVRIDEVLALTDVDRSFRRLRDRDVQGKLLLDLS
jgi:NADPH2:quinone reductase